MDADRQLVQMLRSGVERHRGLADRMDRMADDLAANLDGNQVASETRRSAAGGAHRQTAGTADADRGFRQRNGKKSIAQRVYELLSEDGRAWSPREMTAEFDRRGIKVYSPGSKDRTKNVRHQLAELAKSGKAVRVGEGQYRSVAAVTAPTAAPELSAPSFSLDPPASNGAEAVHAADGG